MRTLKASVAISSTFKASASDKRFVVKELATQFLESELL